MINALVQVPGRLAHGQWQVIDRLRLAAGARALTGSSRGAAPTPEKELNPYPAISIITSLRLRKVGTQGGS